MNLFSAVIGFLAALPDLLKLLSQVCLWLKRISGDDIPNFIKKVNDAFDELNSAKTQEERANAAKAISEIIRNTKH